MSEKSLSPRCGVLAAFAATLGFAVLAGQSIFSSAVGDSRIRSFQVQIPESALVDLRRRIAETRWPDKETVTDRSQGNQLGKLQEIVRYWGTDYNWRKVEARLNALPMFMTEIDGVDIHFIHVKSRHANALPLIITHGWPGSVIEQLKVIEPLTNPTAHGGQAEDAFDVVIPSMPGYGFSGKPTGTGWNPERIARAWAELMKRLGYTRYVAQGGDWGSPVSSAMARQAPAGLLGIHINLPATVPPEVAAVLAAGGSAPADSPRRNARRSTRSTRSSRSTGPTAQSWARGRRRSATPWRTLQWGLRPGYLITTTASPSACSTETTCWTISRCIG